MDKYEADAKTRSTMLRIATALERIADSLDRMSSWTMTLNWTRELDLKDPKGKIKRGTLADGAGRPYTVRQVPLKGGTDAKSNIG